MINNMNPAGSGGQLGKTAAVRRNARLDGADHGGYEVPSDSFTQGENLAKGPSMANLASAVLDAKGIKSKEYKYTIRDQESAPDGSHYVAYYDWQKSKGNYITALDPEGNVKWEITAGEDGVRGLIPGKDGFLYVQTGKGVMGVNPDGSESFRLPPTGT